MQACKGKGRVQGQPLVWPGVRGRDAARHRVCMHGPATTLPLHFEQPQGTRVSHKIKGRSGVRTLGCRRERVEKRWRV